jgi:hypothetical protein
MHSASLFLTVPFLPWALVDFNQDLKPLNIMKVGEVWKLIDLDAAAKIGKKAGLKSSTGYVPPELLVVSSSGEASVRDPAQADALIAHSSFDMWSFGALLYLLITGQTIFNNNQEDNLDDQDLVRLYEWKDADLQAALRKVHNPKRGKCQPLGRDLLEKLLQPEAGERPRIMEDVLDHPFFVGESTEELEKEREKLQIQLKEAQERGETAETLQTLKEEIAKNSGVISELKATADRVEKGVEEANKKLDMVIEKLCGLQQMGLDQIEGKHKCPSAMILVQAEDELSGVWTEVWTMIEPEEEKKLKELEARRKRLQVQATKLVEDVTRVIPPKKTWGIGFFAREHIGVGAEATAKSIADLVSSAKNVTLGFVEWIKGTWEVFESMYLRAKALQEEQEVDAKKAAELLKLTLIVAKDIISVLKDLRQWYRYFSKALKQWKKKFNNLKQQFMEDAKKALEVMERVRNTIREKIQDRLHQVMQWCILNHAELRETCENMYSKFKADESLDEDGGDSTGDGDGDGDGTDDVDVDADADGNGGDFMSDMKSYCFRKFGNIAESEVNKRAKLYDKVQIHLLCEYGECHVPQGM